jgi:hypothetical protein
MSISAAVQSLSEKPSRSAPTAAALATYSAFALGGCLIAIGVAWSASLTGDYTIHGQVGGDNPAPAINALLHGQIGRFATAQPLMGLTSILLRIPFAAAATAVGGGNLLAYRLGAIACLMPGGLLVASLAYSVRPSLRELAPLALLALLATIVLAGPMTLAAVNAGHPEEVLASVLAAAAVLAATRERNCAAAILLGLAVGTKQWALIAAFPVAASLQRNRVRFALTAGAVALMMLAPAPLLNPGAFATASRSVGSTHFANAFSIWWPFGTDLGKGGLASVRILPLGLSRSDASLLLLTAVIVASAAARACRRIDGLALLALLALIRCAADPLPIEYYYVPLIVALAGWETVSLRRMPVAALLSTFAVVETFRIGPHQQTWVLCCMSLSWMSVLAGYLIRHAFYGPPRGRETGGRGPQPPA